MSNKIIFPIVLFLYLAFLTFGALSSDVGKLVPNGYDKILHLAEFFILVILIYFTLSAYGFDKLFLFVATFLISVLLAILSEYAQLWLTKTRTFSWLDFVADAIGICFALILLVVFEWISLKQLFLE